MAVISVFYGIIISLYFFDNRQHHLPHKFNGKTGWICARIPYIWIAGNNYLFYQNKIRRFDFYP